MLITLLSFRKNLHGKIVPEYGALIFVEKQCNLKWLTAILMR